MGRLKDFENFIVGKTPKTREKRSYHEDITGRRYEELDLLSKS